MKVLLTGAGGVIGRETLRLLAEAGHEVTPWSGRTRVEAGVQLRSVDLRQPRALQRAGVARPDVVVHLAAELPADRSLDIAAGLATQQIDRSVLETCAAWQTPVVYASGTSLYAPGDVACTEASPLAPQVGYLQAKLLGEQLGAELLRSRGIGFTVLRVSAVYGPGQRARTVLQLFLERARRSEPIRYYGSGSREQDFIHARDVAAAIVRALATGADGTFNIAAGVGIGMRALADLAVAAVPGSRSVVEPAGMPDPQEGRRARFDVSRAARQLGWQPRIELEAGLAECARALVEMAL